MSPLINTASKIIIGLYATASMAFAQVGLTEIQGNDGDGDVIVFYPTRAEAVAVQRGPFTLQVANSSQPQAGNRKLIVISHGSGGVPWTHSDLALRLVRAGFIVAFPDHKGDNFQSTREAGPVSWKRRPLEVSRAIDAVSKDPRFASILDFSKVGMYGMSAGGHTALTLAGGKWSIANLGRHCEAHIAEDFQTCVGLLTHLTGGMMDNIKKNISLTIIRNKLTDETEQGHTDPRIYAIVAGVPFSVDFDLRTLKTPKVTLALVTAAKDKWLIPRFHSDAVLAACATCIQLGHFASGGHGALLSPLPIGLTGLLAEMLNDPPGFDRKESLAMNATITAFFRKQLVN